MSANNKIYSMRVGYCRQPWYDSEDRYELLYIKEQISLTLFGPEGVFISMFTNIEQPFFMEIMEPVTDEETRELRLKLLLEY